MQIAIIIIAGTDQPTSRLPGDSDLNRGFTEELADKTLEVEQSCCSPEEGANEPGSVEFSLLVSASVGAWDILIGLMSSLKGVAQLYLEQGIVKESHHYAREGAMLAMELLLPGW